MGILCDVGAERAVLAGVCKFGGDVYADVSDILSEKAFTVDSNGIIYKCLKEIFKHDSNAQIDIPSIYSAAKGINLEFWFKKPDEVEHLKALFNFGVKKDNVREFAKRVRKLEVTRLLADNLESAKSTLLGVKGTEPINSILAIAEDAVFNFSALLGDDNDGPIRICDGMREFAQELEANKSETIGISSGFPVYDEAIGGGFRPATLNVISARPKTGKMQPIDAEIITPTGPKLLGDLVEGDYVCTPFGRTSKITHIWEHGLQDIYKVTFSNNDTVECGLDHLWEVKNRRKKDYRVKTLRDILVFGLYENDRPKWQVRVTKPVFMNKQKLTIEPYLLGLLIGDGCLREPKPNWYREELKGLWNLKSNDKFIPKEYLFSTINDRLELIRGLFDSDGHIDDQGRIEYSTSSKQLAEDVKLLAHSLGAIAKIKKRIIKCNNKEFKSYRLYIAANDTTPFFKLSRKMNNGVLRKKPDLKLTITNIELIGKKVCKCITIRDIHGLYLTNNYIVTHNSTFCKSVGIHIAKNLNIPVLLMDTEMTERDQRARILSEESAVKLRDVERGKFSENDWTKHSVYKAATKLDGIPFYYKRIPGMAFEEQLATIRRWIVKTVKVRDDGKANHCVIIYDYFKLMDGEGLSAEMKEYQLLGFMMTNLANFASRYDIPFLVMMQQNREFTHAMSDRILWFCSNYSSFMRKSDDEIADDGPEAGNRKLIPEYLRHGEDWPSSAYICFKMDGTMKMRELGTNIDIKKKKDQKNDAGFEQTDEQDETL